MTSVGVERPVTSQISEVTRRDLFDYLTSEGVAWWGRLDELAFLSRLYDLESLPSTDSRFRTAYGDIHQHRVNNYDWEDDWVFYDPRFHLQRGPDEILLSFLAQIVHPVVRANHEQADRLVTAFNALLSSDGWMLRPEGAISGRPIYVPARIGAGAGIGVKLARATATAIGQEYVSQQVTRMQSAIDSDPELAIGTAKEFLETVCKTILDERRIPYASADDLPALARKAAKALQLRPEDVDQSAKAAQTIKRIVINLGSVVQGTAELRNAYGTGHGRSASGAPRLRPRHARLAVGASATVGAFLFETHKERGIT